MPVSAGAIRAGVVLAAGFALSAEGAAAATSLVRIRVSPDVTIALGGTTLHDEGIVADTIAGGIAAESLGPIPAEADLDAFTILPNGDRLLSFDVAVALPGGVTAQPADVVRWNGSIYSIEFSAAAAGVPPGANVDAVVAYRGALLLSFDTSVKLGAVQVEREDLVLFDASGFSLFFDGSTAGVPAGLNLDGADEIDCNGRLLLSFDGSGVIGGVRFDDENVLEFDRAATWEMAYDGSARNAAWIVADLDAFHATPDLGPGPPVVFGQTVKFDADKATLRWPNPDSFKAVRGRFTTSSDIGSYGTDWITTGFGTTLSDASTPPAGRGSWYLVKRWGCIQSSWQSSLGAEPGRDPAIP